MLEERTRMARELHDTLAQGFAGIVLQLEAVEDVLPEGAETARKHILRACTLARESLAEARRSVWELRPYALEHGDLTTVLSHLLNQLTAGTQVQAQFFSQGTPQALPSDAEENLLRIAQEAVSNVLFHAQAHTVRVTLTFTPQTVQLYVEDDGQGFDPRHIPSGSFGLIGMQERVKRIGGELTLTSQPGQGTKLTVTVPVPSTAQEGSPHV